MNVSVEGIPCQYPKDNGGPCFGRLTMYFFNSEAQRCLPFIYKGCGGNGNRFATVAMCQKRCSPSLQTQAVPKRPSIQATFHTPQIPIQQTHQQQQPLPYAPRGGIIQQQPQPIIGKRK